jgi:hypothetical protein
MGRLGANRDNTLFPARYAKPAKLHRRDFHGPPSWRTPLN